MLKQRPLEHQVNTNFSQKRPRKDAPSKTAFSKFEKAFAKKYAQELTEFDECALREKDEYKETFALIDDVGDVDEEGEEIQLPPTRKRNARKARYACVLSLKGSSLTCALVLSVYLPLGRTLASIRTKAERHSLLESSLQGRRKLSSCIGKLITYIGAGKQTEGVLLSKRRRRRRRKRKKILTKTWKRLQGEL
jgi:hypothetical protein